MKAKFIVFSFLICIISCNGQEEKPQKTQTKISTTQNKKYSDTIELLKSSMTEYMKSTEVSYTKTDIEECINILKQYLNNISKTKSKEEGLAIVKSTVLKLNTLNEKCDSGLIETSERETIAEIIISASSDKGYNSLNEDITEEWREW